MILGLGIDLVQTARVETELSRGQWSSDDGVFTPGEIGRANSSRKPGHYYAACFAIKEAALKALDLPIDDLAMFREVEVQRDSAGEYRLALHGRTQARLEQLGAHRASLAITHRGGHVAAIVIIEG